MAKQPPYNIISKLWRGSWGNCVRGVRERSKKYVTAWGISFFVSGIVFSNSFAEYVLVLSLIDFLTSIRGQQLPYAAATINLIEGLGSVLSILGALLSDAHLGRFWVIFFSVPCYILGLGLFTLSASDKLSAPPTTALFYIALLFIAAGRGGQQHTLRAFGRDQFESKIGDGVKARIHNRAWWYLGTLVGVVAGITVNSFLSQEDIDRDRPSLSWVFGGIFSLAAMVVTLVLFASGTSLFTRVTPQGSPLLRVLRVFLAALQNRRLRYPENAGQLFEERNGCLHDSVPSNILKDPSVVYSSLPHTEGLRCLDRAAIRDPSDHQDAEAQVRRWKLCTVTQVEETKVLLRLFPIWSTFLMYGVVLSMGDTLFLEQGGNLDNHLSKQMTVPLSALLAFSRFSDVVTIQFLLPLVNRVLKLDEGIPPKMRIGLGLLISIPCCVTAAEVESRRLIVVKEKGLIDDAEDTVPMSIFYLVPQFVLLGVMEGFMSDGLSGFFEDHVPPRMRVYKELSSESVIGAGSLISALLIVTTREATMLGGKRSWFQYIVNGSRLDLFYWLITILSVVNLLFYVFVAVKQSPPKLPPAQVGDQYKNEEEEEDDRDQEMVEQVAELHESLT
ncbi:hypothetical protein H6P81_006850 [Aristolochia fimbriata]|uniref:NPF family transporter n=1 Tax=Aristolochia fimbriata TaxID=158543 RepID=A0AAV7F277_ARIFI|nr:hypothetical protein H6P81_006850 [Aristolochia fimbriata]